MGDQFRTSPCKKSQWLVTDLKEINLPVGSTGIDGSVDAELGIDHGLSTNGQLKLVQLNMTGTHIKIDVRFEHVPYIPSPFDLAFALEVGVMRYAALYPASEKWQRSSTVSEEHVQSSVAVEDATEEPNQRSGDVYRYLMRADLHSCDRNRCLKWKSHR